MQSDPIELTPPDIGAHARGTHGIAYVHSFAAASDGPHVVLNALMHGNELCGAIVLDRLLRAGVRPRRGRLSLCFANVEAFRRFDPAAPALSRFVDEDMNRVWGELDTPRRSVELSRARALWPVFADADLVLDIHSMQTAAAPLTLCGRSDRGRALARRVGFPRWIVADAGHAAGLRLIDHPRFAGPEGGAAAILVECGQHWASASADVAEETAWRFLAAVGALDASDLPERHRRPPPPAQAVEVTAAITARTESFAFARPFAGMEVIAETGSLIARDGGEEIRTPYPDCILIMPSPRVRPGQTAVRLGRVVG